MRIVLFTGKGGVGKTTDRVGHRAASGRSRRQDPAAVDRHRALARRRAGRRRCPASPPRSRRACGRCRSTPSCASRRRGATCSGSSSTCSPAAASTRSPPTNSPCCPAWTRCSRCSRCASSPSPATGTRWSSTARRPRRRCACWRCPRRCRGTCRRCSRPSAASPRACGRSRRMLGRGDVIPPDNIFEALLRLNDELAGGAPAARRSGDHLGAAGAHPEVGGRRRGAAHLHRAGAVRLPRRPGRREPGLPGRR